MRLGQLARKLDLRPSEIIEFLAGNNILIDEGSNTRLEEDHVALVVRHFASSATVETESQQEKTADAEMTFPREPEIAEDEQTEIKPVTLEHTITPGTHGIEKPEVIKAVKVELSGLKVVGKIELPEPKKKEPPANAQSNDGVPTENEPKKETQPGSRKAASFKKTETGQRPWKNPLAMQREREKKEAEKRRQAEAQQAKDQRTKNYFKKVKTAPPTKRAKLVQEHTMELSPAELKEDPKTWVGKLFRWLQT